MAPRKPTAPVDDDVIVPPSVKAAAARADELHKQAYQTQDPPSADPPEVPQDPPPADPQVTPPVTSPPTDPPAPAPQDPSPTPVSDDWQHKYNSMKGRYERMEQANHLLMDRLSGMEATITAMQATPPAPDPDPPAPSITEEELSEYGPEFVDFVRRAVAGANSDEVSSLKNEVASLKNQLSGVDGQMTKNARDKMHDDLSKEIPNWMEVNNNPDFVAWLSLPDPYSGAIRHELLNQAYDRNQTARVLAFFKGFLNEAALSPPATPGHNPPPGPAPVVPLSDLAAPGRAKTAAPSDVPAEKPLLTRAQVKQFYDEVTAGKYRGNDDEKNRLERMIHEAAREGRIR